MFLVKSLISRHSVVLKFFEVIKSSFGLYSENFVYGNVYILNEYAGVPIGTRLIGRLEHSPYLSHIASGRSKSSINTSTYRNNLSDTYVWLKRDEDSARRMGWNNFKAIGAPWLYFLELKNTHGFKNFASLNERSIDELWIFANHSDDKFDGGITPELREFFNGVRKSKANSKLVSLFYTDFYSLTQEDREEFADLNIVTLLGSRAKSSSANAHFYSLYHMLGNIKCLVLDFPSTMMLYAMTLNCEIKWFKNASYFSVLKEAKEKGSLKLLELMDDKQTTTQFRINFAEEELGRESLKSPQELRDAFGWHLNGLSVRTAVFRTFKSLVSSPYRYLHRED